ncbi:MAG: hypothetical protein QGH15_19090 [Kiritimatiellia bacterium]|jgi:hypothetical protein|nr:hypothetical protein [Kiritimatiellia bacterium]
MKTIRYILASLAALAFLACVLFAVLDVVYMIHGSLEEFPTDEDHAKVRDACIFTFFILAAVGGLSGTGAWKLWPRKEKDAEQSP